MIKISYIKSEERQYNIERCLALIKSEITREIKLAKRVVIKVDATVSNNPGMVTNAHTLDAILKCIAPFVKGQITLAEGTLSGDTLTAFKNYNYLQLQSNYDLALVDLNTDDYVPMQIKDKDGRTIDVKVAKTLAESDYIITVSLPKTHPKVLYSGAIHNIISGCLTDERTSWLSKIIPKYGSISNKNLIYQEPKQTAKNITELYDRLTPKLAVIDCFETVQGDNALRGDNIQTHFAIASTNAVAADYLACKCLDLEIEDIGYLSTLSLLTNDIFVIGDDYEKHKFKIKLPSTYEKIRHWK